MAKKILCTLGPASLNEHVIRRLEQCGTSLFRINLSHTKTADLAATVKLIQAHSVVPICLDTEGAQIRTGDFVDGSVTLRDNTFVRAHRRRVPADGKNFNFYPADIVDRLRIGDFISIDFNAVLVQVIADEPDAVVMRVLNGGVVGQNKAVTVERDVPLPPLTDKDRACIEIGIELGLTHFALSFANRGEDVDALRALVGDSAEIISKIESRKGIENLADIAHRSDALLIDRGDLSREVPIELLPRTQKSILRHAKLLGIRVYVATNLLESMVHTPNPTRAEVNDIYNTLLDGADGLVLAAETAIGAYPIHCASMINRLIQGYERDGDADTLYYPSDPVSLLIEPHGGQLVHREATEKECREVGRLPTLTVPETTLLDCEQLACGTYSPLTGFMDRTTLVSVLETHRLPDGEVWPLPIFLQVPAADVRGFGVGESVALRHESGRLIARLDVTDIYTFDLEDLTQRMYGTRSADHPGVARILGGGEVFIAGNITLIEQLSSVYRHYQLTPAQTRFIFTRLGWSRVVGFHGRNPVHRGHEEIQLRALERADADGLYINPVIGPKRKGDFLPDPIMLSYQTMLEFGCYPKGKVVLGCFSTYPRYAGPREAVFTALCRKNMGCSHFIIGRDHAGIGDFYAPDANRRLFDDLGDIGVEPLFFDAVGYNPETARYDVGTGEAVRLISGSEVRETLKCGDHLPDWFMRDIVQDVLRGEIESGRPVFYE